MREAIVSKVWAEGEPACLRKLLPETDRRQNGVSRADRRGEIQHYQPQLMIGKKAFRSWGPEAYNAVCSRVKTRPPPAERAVKDTRRPGKVPEDQDILQRKAYYGYLAHKYQGRAETRDEDGRTVVWTDGSAVEDERGVWHAGAGIFYGNGNGNNRSISVTGPQTNQRAELTAVLHCLETVSGPIHIKTDSRYVQLGIQQGLRKWKGNAWFKRVHAAEEIEHVDLWQRLDNIIGHMDDGAVKVTWLKGHAMPRHIALGLTTEGGIWGNNAADALAGRASLQCMGG